MKMKTFHILWMLLMLKEVKAGCRPNGCSVWGIIPYKTFFVRACNKHDVCYACGDDHGWNRKQCDEAFKNDMYELCKSGSKFKSVCKGWAWTYYKAVQRFGGKHWKQVSPNWCDTCPKSSGDPNKLLK